MTSVSASLVKSLVLLHVLLRALLTPPLFPAPVARAAAARGRKRPNPELEAEHGTCDGAKEVDAHAPLLEPTPSAPAPEPAPAQGPAPPSQHGAAQPKGGILQFCTMLLHQLVGVAVDKAQGNRWENHASMERTGRKALRALQLCDGSAPHLQGACANPLPLSMQ